MRDHDFLFQGSSESGQNRSGSDGPFGQERLQDCGRHRELLIELKGVSKSLDEKCILHRLNVQIPRNRIIGLAGRNGSGKSTLLKLMAGIWKPDEGRIFRYTKRISYLMPRDIFYRWMRVRDAVQFYQSHYQNFASEKACGLIENMGFDR